MKSRTFVPGAIATPGAITLPADAPDIDAVVSAQIIRAPSAVAIANHPVHAHDLVFGAAQANAVTVGAASTPLGSAAPGTLAGGGATGIQNIAAAQAHVATGANPVVAAVPTKITNRTFSLDVNTLLGDLLTINFRELGERVLTS